MRWKLVLSVTLCVLLGSAAANFLFGGFSWRNALIVGLLVLLGAVFTEAILSFSRKQKPR